MRVTYQPWGHSLAELVDAGRRAEDAGADGLWVSELHRSATISAAALAAATRHASVGTCVALAFIRSPMILALEALDLDELASGRFVLGLGTGVKRLNEQWHNVAWDRPVGRLSETVRNVRAVWASCASGAPIDLGGVEPLRLHGYQRDLHQERARIPVYLAAVGPQLTALTGRIADGWISHELTSPTFVREQTLPQLTAALDGAGRARADLDVVVSACCSISPDPALARRRAAGLVGFYASVRTYADFFAFHGLAHEQQAVIDAFGAGRAADDLADVVADEMIDTLTLTGTAADVLARIGDYRGLADTIKLSPPTHGLAEDEIRAAQEEILALIPQIKENAA